MRISYLEQKEEWKARIFQAKEAEHTETREDETEQTGGELRVCVARMQAAGDEDRGSQ